MRGQLSFLSKVLSLSESFSGFATNEGFSSKYDDIF
jgi:hypothetical protein